MSKPEEIIPKLKKETMLSLLSKGERLDGRRLTDFRDIRIETNVIEKAEGSAIVYLGNTIVIAGVKTSIGTPFSDSPYEGVQIVNTELIPLASPVFEPGPPGEEDVELSRVVDRALRSAKALNLKKLCIIPGKRVWYVYIDIYALNHDGNLIDASALAAISALVTAKFPKVEVHNNEIKILDEKVPLPIEDIPVTVTFAKICDKIVVDPTYEEELVMDSRITFGINGKGEICTIQKGLKGTFTVDEILYSANIAREISKKLRDLVSKVIEASKSL